MRSNNLIVAVAMIAMAAAAWTGTTGLPTGTQIKIAHCSGNCVKEDAPPIIVQDKPTQVASWVEIDDDTIVPMPS